MLGRAGEMAQQAGAWAALEHRPLRLKHYLSMCVGCVCARVSVCGCLPGRWGQLESARCTWVGVDMFGVESFYPRHGGHHQRCGWGYGGVGHLKEWQSAGPLEGASFLVLASPEVPCQPVTHHHPGPAFPLPQGKLFCPPLPPSTANLHGWAVASVSRKPDLRHPRQGLMGYRGPHTRQPLGLVAL